MNFLEYQRMIAPPTTSPKSSRRRPVNGSGTPPAQEFARFKTGGNAVKRQVASIVATVNSMSDEEFRQSLIAAGIITKTGRLTKPYRS